MNEPSIEIEVIPVLEDNFEYLIVWPRGAAVVDPAVAAPIRTRLEAHKIRLTHIFITHDHGDHIAGVAELQKLYGAEIIAPAGAKLFPENLRAGMPASLFLNGGEKLEFSGLRVEAIPTPGHCAAHIAFFLPDAKAVFTGDCLFGAGCGRLFGNPPEIMFQSLRLLAALPDETRVFFGHEYTVSNLRFARTIEPARGRGKKSSDFAKRHRARKRDERFSSRARCGGICDAPIPQRSFLIFRTGFSRGWKKRARKFPGIGSCDDFCARGERPLTPALSPRRGEGVAARKNQKDAARLKGGALFTQICGGEMRRRSWRRR